MHNAQAKHASLPWDTIFSTELFDTFKPSVRHVSFPRNRRAHIASFPHGRNPKAYNEAMRHLALPPARCAMVAAHIYDLRAAAGQGMVTVYVRRPHEDIPLDSPVRSKKDGGEVDYVVDSFLEIADIIELKQAA